MARKLWYEGTVRSSISIEIWQQIKAAYAAGIGLREIARKMNLPEGTALCWPKQSAKVGRSKLQQQTSLAVGSSSAP